MIAFQEFLKLVLGTTILSAAIIAGAVWLFREWLTAKLSASVRHSYDEKLEKLRASLAQQREVDLIALRRTIDERQSTLAGAQASLAGAQTAAAERRLLAIDAMWQAIVHERNAFPLVIRIIDALRPDELRQTFRKGSAALSDFDYHHYQQYLDQIRKNKIEHTRPYLGDALYGQCELYRAFCSRLIHHNLELRENPDGEQWNENLATISVVKALLTQEEFRQFESLQFSKIAHVHRHVEARIIAAMARLISGEQLAHQTMEQGKALLRLLASLDQSGERISEKVEL